MSDDDMTLEQREAALPRIFRAAVVNAHEIIKVMAVNEQGLTELDDAVVRCYEELSRALRFESALDEAKAERARAHRAELKRNREAIKRDEQARKNDEQKWKLLRDRAMTHGINLAHFDTLIAQLRGTKSKKLQAKLSRQLDLLFKLKEG